MIKKISKSRKTNLEYDRNRLKERLQHDTILMVDIIPLNIRCRGGTPLSSSGTQCLTEKQYMQAEKMLAEVNIRRE